MNTQIASTQQVAEILAKPYSRKLTPDPSGGYVATIHEFPGCVAHGESADEALSNLSEAAESWIEAAIETGFSIPDPANYDSSSGKIALRMSRRLHQIATERADLEGVSLNQFISGALASYLGQKSGIDTAIAAATEKLNEVCSNFLWISSRATSSSDYWFFTSSHPHRDIGDRFLESTRWADIKWANVYTTETPQTLSLTRD